jgi:hypothetical protein
VYEIVSKNGWRSCTLSQQEAIEVADLRHKQWWELGLDVPVEVWHKGKVIYTISGDPKKG